MVENIIKKAKCIDIYKRDMRYDPDWLLECLVLHIKSPTAYRHISVQNLLAVPSLSTIKTLMSSMANEYGVCQHSLDALKQYAVGKSINELYCLVGHDEIGVGADVQFNKYSHSFDGLINRDYETGKEVGGQVASDHVCSFIIRFFQSKLSVTILTVPARGAVKGTMLYRYFLLVVMLCHDVGLHVLASTCDGAQPNVTFWNNCGVFGRNKRKHKFNNRMKNPAQKGDKFDDYIYFFRCLCHIIKCYRNHFENHRRVRVCSHFLT